MVRNRAALFPDAAFEFVREGLKFTVTSLHGRTVAPNGGTNRAVANVAAAGTGGAGKSPRRHVSGQQLCEGLRDMAMQRWGLLAPTVLKKWGIERTEDFGTIVYAMIDREELKTSDGDSIEDFRAVFDFDQVFGAMKL